MIEPIASSLIAHGVGDYVLQSHWMATEKVKRWWPAAVHAVTYGLPFLVITRSPYALLVIVGTHAIIDRYRLARHFTWVKNLAAPRSKRHTWEESKVTGYPPAAPEWLAIWLMIITDNVLHISINVAAITWL